jgi:hypothetical protein
VTEQMGLEFIWIDSLCILQDSVKDVSEFSWLILDVVEPSMSPIKH